MCKVISVILLLLPAFAHAECTLSVAPLNNSYSAIYSAASAQPTTTTATITCPAGQAWALGYNHASALIKATSQLPHPSLTAMDEACGKP